MYDPATAKANGWWSPARCPHCGALAVDYASFFVGSADMRDARGRDMQGLIDLSSEQESWIRAIHPPHPRLRFSRARTLAMVPIVADVIVLPLLALFLLDWRWLLAATLLLYPTAKIYSEVGKRYPEYRGEDEAVVDAWSRRRICLECRQWVSEVEVAHD